MRRIGAFVLLWALAGCTDEADKATDLCTEPAVDEDGATLKGEDAANEEREEAGHEQAGVADLVELFGHGTAATEHLGCACQRAAEQHQHLSEFAEHFSNWRRMG